jgi:pyruvate,water dikinase
MTGRDENVRWFEEIGASDVGQVGGKNASLGEMIRSLKESGVRVPEGFATTAHAYRLFLAGNGLEVPIREQLERLKTASASLQETGQALRGMLLDSEFPAPVAEAIVASYRELCRHTGQPEIAVAVRSSATAEDLPEASFAGQQETFLNVRGERALLHACRRCYASLFTDRAISYRETKGFDHMQVALSAGVQRMVRSDLAGSGVMFSIDTESGFPGVVVIDAAWGLGETVVQGSVIPDKHIVFKAPLDDPRTMPIVEKKLGSKEKKLIYALGGSGRTRLASTSRSERQSFVLDDAEVLQLARWAVLIERHYGRPMDMEWAKDGETGELAIVQARPETVQALSGAAPLKVYRLKEKKPPLLSGAAIGQAIAAAPVCLIRSAREIDR